MERQARTNGAHDLVHGRHERAHEALRKPTIASVMRLSSACALTSQAGKFSVSRSGPFREAEGAQGAQESVLTNARSRPRVCENALQCAVSRL